MLKPEDNPPISWPDGKPLCEFTGQWRVAHTKSRNEKALAADLIGKNISYFLPMHWYARKQRGRAVRTLLPLFGGYLFFCGDENQRVEVLKTNRVANIIEVKDQQRLIGELSQIERAIKAGVNLSPHRYIKVGQKCKIIAGSLAGLHGVVLATKTSMRFILQVDMLGQAASVEIDADIIEKIEELDQ